MSDLDAYRSLYVAESRENHEAIVSNLLSLEQGTDSHAIDEIFRSAHSLKGMSASMGFMHMEEICHALEDVFSQIRSGTLEVSQSLMDDLLAGVDDIELMIDDIEGGGDGLLEHRDERVASLKKWISGHGKPAPESSPAQVSPPASLVSEPEESGTDMYENPAYESYDQAGTATYLIHLELSPDVDSRNLRSMLILQNLESIGTLSSITPPRTTVEDDPLFAGTIDLTLVTNAGREAVETILAITDIKSSTITDRSGDSPSYPEPVISSPNGLEISDSKRFHVHVELSPAVDSKNLRAMLLLQNLESLGTLCKHLSKT
jgi:two-component system, chemotaxis family, sensor kinase CheA